MVQPTSNRQKETQASSCWTAGDMFAISGIHPHQPQLLTAVLGLFLWHRLAVSLSLPGLVHNACPAVHITSSSNYYT